MDETAFQVRCFLWHYTQGSNLGWRLTVKYLGEHLYPNKLIQVFHNMTVGTSRSLSVSMTAESYAGQASTVGENWEVWPTHASGLRETPLLAWGVHAWYFRQRLISKTKREEELFGLGVIRLPCLGLEHRYAWFPGGNVNHYTMQLLYHICDVSIFRFGLAKKLIIIMNINMQFAFLCNPLKTPEVTKRNGMHTPKTQRGILLTFGQRNNTVSQK